MFRSNKQLAIFIALLAATLASQQEVSAFSLLGPLSRVRRWVVVSRDTTTASTTATMPDAMDVAPTNAAMLFYRNGGEDDVMISSSGATATSATGVVAMMKQPPPQAFVVTAATTTTARDTTRRIGSGNHANNNKLPNQFELPRRLDPMARVRTRVLGEMEILLGRIAMVAAIVLLTVEVTTGQSLPDQILGGVTSTTMLLF